MALIAMLPWMRREPAPVHATDVHCVGGGHFSVRLHRLRAHVGMTTVSQLTGPFRHG